MGFFILSCDCRPVTQGDGRSGPPVGVPCPLSGRIRGLAVVWIRRCDLNSRVALVVGASDGVGLALCRRLVSDNWKVVGISRSPGSIEDAAYEHVLIDVTADNYAMELGGICDRVGTVDLCVYCAGIGETLDVDHLERQHRVFAVNLMGAVSTIDVVVARMVTAGQGHFIGLSSMADRLIAPTSPSYSASKAGFTSYLRSLAVALRSKNVYVTNVRFGFVDTKMAVGPVRPMMMPVEKAVDILMGAIRTRPVQVSRPRTVAFIVGLVGKLAAVRPPTR